MTHLDKRDRTRGNAYDQVLGWAAAERKRNQGQLFVTTSTCTYTNGALGDMTLTQKRIGHMVSPSPRQLTFFEFSNSSSNIAAIRMDHKQLDWSTDCYKEFTVLCLRTSSSVLHRWHGEQYISFPSHSAQSNVCQPQSHHVGICCHSLPHSIERHKQKSDVESVEKG